MLTRIEIDGFKSFTNFSMEFSPLTIIAGLNASGKSNLFDALHLLSLLAEHDLNTAFDKVQRGRNLELFTQYADGRYVQQMHFGLEVLIDGKKSGDEDSGRLYLMRYELSIGCLVESGIPSISVNYERVGLIRIRFLDENGKWMQVDDEGERETANIALEGAKETSLSYIHRLSKEKKEAFNKIYSVQQEIRSWKLIHLNPEKIPAVTPSQAFGLPGPLNSAADNLAGVFWRLSKTDSYLLTRIAQRLASLVPGIKEIVVRHDDYYNQYRVFVHTTAGQRFPLHLLSEGTLRMLALCTLAFDDQQHGVLGLEEPENGVHPGLLKRVAELLFDLSNNAQDEGGEPWPLRQVIVNTHSPGLIKACLEAAAGQEGSGKPGLTVWFSQLVGRAVEEGGKRVMRRVTDMLPVVLPKIQPSEAATAELSESERRVSMAQLLRYLDTTADDPLLHELGLPAEPATPRA